MIKLLKNKWLLRSAGLIIFAFIFIFKIDFRQFFIAAAQLKSAYLFVLLILFGASTVVTALRWKFLLKKAGIDIGFAASYHMVYSSMFIGLTTPGRIGELLGRASFFADDKELLTKSLAVMLFEKLTDVFFLVFLASVSILFFLSRLPAEFGILAVIALSIFLAVILLSFKQGNIFKKMISHIIPSKFINWHGFLAIFSDYVKNFGYWRYLVFGFYTIMVWLLAFLFVYVFALGLEIKIPFVYLVMTSSISSLVSLIPISIAGLGTREAVFLLLLAPYGITNEKIVLLSLASNLFLIALVAIVGFICILFKPKLQNELIKNR